MATPQNESLVLFEDLQQLTKDKSVLIIDVRQPDELQSTGSIPNSINIPLAEVEYALNGMPEDEFLQKFNRNKPSKDDRIIFSCRSGNRSTKAYSVAQQLGYTRADNYKGGWLDWESKIKTY